MFHNEDKTNQHTREKDENVVESAEHKTQTLIKYICDCDSCCSFLKQFPHSSSE